jgi:hypothetical protein
MTIRLTYDRYEWLRTAAFQHRIPMQQIIDEAIDLLRCTPDWSETLGDDKSEGSNG